MSVEPKTSAASLAKSKATSLSRPYLHLTIHLKLWTPSYSTVIVVGPCPPCDNAATPRLFEQRAIDTSVLNTWDATVVGRFDLLWLAGSAERESCELTISNQCLLSLDRTVNDLRKRAQSRGTRPTACGAELAALRSAAIEVATEQYVGRLVSRAPKRCPDGARPSRSNRPNGQDGSAREVIQRATAQAGGATVVCSLPPAVLGRLDEVVKDVLRQNDLALGESVTLEAMRSMVVESVLMAWLMLRGSSSMARNSGAPRGWLRSVASMARAGARRWRRRPVE